MSNKVVPSNVLTVRDCEITSISTLLRKYHLDLQLVTDKITIPGSYWGESEAGLISNTVYARQDTPVHSLLHETCHYICMDKQRREKLDTNAEGDYDEENGVCYLQILLSDELPNVGRIRMMKDMDSWGYTFREGSAESWFKGDAVDAFKWLKKHHILDSNGLVKYSLRC